MFAVFAAILFSIAEVLHLLHIQDYTVQTFWLAGCISTALALIPALPALWRSR